MTQSIWAIGDLQGCCTPLEQLLSHPEIAQDEHAQFWFAGDLINRGPESLQTIRRVMALGDRAVTVLGNHDLHLLAVSAGIRKSGKSDTLLGIFDAPDAQEILSWMRNRPLAHYAQGHLLVHAGAHPSWTLAQTLQLSHEVEAALRAPDWHERLAKMYGNEPAQWDDELRGADRLRVIINATTRMRMCEVDGTMDFSHKRHPADARPGLLPWYDVPQRPVAKEAVVVCGHWSTLGLMMRDDVLSLDTGCVWGGQLTAVRLQDRKVIQIPCTQYSKPKEGQ